MSVRFHTLTIADVRRETPDAIAITFVVPDDLKPVFQYKQGQYITVRVDVDGVSHRRNYSLCSSPVLDEPLTIGVKRINDGVVSGWLNDRVRVGDSIEVYPPMGNFTKELQPDHARHYVLFGGGSGITPLLSILKSILRVEPGSVITLLYANRNEASIMFDGQLQKLKAEYGDRLRVVHVLEDTASSSREAIAGRMEPDTVRTLIRSWVPDPAIAEFFICGPQGMMQGILDALHERGVDDRHIHREYFTLTKDDMEQTDQVAATDASDEIVTRTVTVRLYGQEHTFEVHPDETILTAAIRENVDPPFACQIGACCTCRAKLTTGRVMMEEREALSDDEMEEGYILTCQSHPLTDGCFADYDQ